MRYASVCSGVGTCALAWHPLGWETAWFAEIEPAPSAILAARFPDVPNHGDMVAIADQILGLQRMLAACGPNPGRAWPDVEALTDIDLLAGGTPCQAFSIAGLRRSLEDTRGNLSLVFCRLVHAIHAVRLARGHGGGLPFVVWENVPGVLSTSDNAFGCFLAGLVGADEPLCPDERWHDAGMVVGPARTAAWRTLDAQYFGLAQRRERVVLVSCPRTGGHDPAEILFEWEGVRRDSAPQRAPREEIAGTLTAGTGQRNGATEIDGGQILPVVAHTLSANGHDASDDGTGRGSPLIPVAFRTAGDGTVYETGDYAASLATGTDPSANVLLTHDDVRRMTPREWERLQGYDDDHTAVPYHGKKRKTMKDGPRYKAIGNGWARNVFAWLGQRIDAAVSP